MPRRGLIRLPSYLPSREVSYVPTLGKGGGYDPAATALFARFTTPPTTARKALINDLIVSLKDGGVWDKLDVLWLIGADSQASTRNWVQDAFNLSAVNSPSFLADRRFASDGSTSYLETGFNLSSASGRKYMLNSAAIGVWCYTDGQSGVVDAGTTNSIILPRNASDLALARANTTTNTSRSNTSAIGLTQVSRTSASDQAIMSPDGGYNNAVISSTAVDNLNMRFLGRSGTVQYAPHLQSGGFVSSGLTEANMNTLRSVFITYLTAIGAYTP